MNFWCQFHLAPFPLFKIKFNYLAPCLHVSDVETFAMRKSKCKLRKMLIRFGRLTPPFFHRFICIIAFRVKVKEYSFNCLTLTAELPGEIYFSVNIKLMIIRSKMGGGNAINIEQNRVTYSLQQRPQLFG